MKIIRTRHGLRLSEHGVVISELHTTPGPTHSVFDVLAALIDVLAPVGRVGVLGFAGGGIMAPLRHLGVESKIESVDLDRTGYDLFRQHCPGWARNVKWQQADALAWLREQPPDFGLLMDDLSVPRDGDVVKPAITWNILPALIRQKLRPGGIAVFNLLIPWGGTWNPALARMAGGFHTGQVISLDGFENRILIAGESLASARQLGALLRHALRRLGSRQVGQVHLRTVEPMR